MTDPAPKDQATSDDNNGTLTALQSELEASKSRLAELTQISQQALADLQNYKKRTEEEKVKFVAFANSILITDLLPILDNFERSLAHIPEDPAAKEWANGILAIVKQMKEILKTRGLEKIATGGQPFAPNLHEAVLTEAGPKDQIIRELEKGYKLADRILRRAKVTVGNTIVDSSTSPLPQENSPTPTTTPHQESSSGSTPLDDNIYA